MDVSSCKELMDRATTDAYLTAVPESLVLGFLLAGWVIWRLLVKIRMLQTEISLLIVSRRPRNGA